MALASFTLRKTIGGAGSFLRKNAGLDNSLRADGFTNSQIIVTGNNTFSANIISTGTVRLEWTLSEALEDESVVVATAPVELLIVSSTAGEPVTINDGVLLTTVTSTSNNTYYDDVPVIQEGRWVYYSLFIKYSDGTDVWYSNAANLYIQIPKSYNSIENLWKRIPEYYQLLDLNQPQLENGYTPLYSFLSLLGNEMDRTRTLIDTIALSNDPEVSVTPALAELAYETGLEITLKDLGTAKARSLLNNIGTLRQRKGTKGSIASYISALSGCPVTYEFSSPTHIFHVYAQRVNFISDPRFQEATISASTGNASGSKLSLQTTPTWGVYTYGTADSGATITPVITNVNDGIQIQIPAGAPNDRTVFVYPRKTFKYATTTRYGSRFDVTLSAGATFNNLHTSTNTTRLAWEAGVAGGSVPPAYFQDSAWISSPNYAYGSTSQEYVLDYPANPAAAFSTITSVPVLMFTAAPGSTIFISKWLLEPDSAGPYFDGNTREGGYIPINTGVVGAGSFDYYWDSAGGANNDFSYYLLDHERTISTVERVIAQYIMPVTMLSSYQIDWNYYLGK
jgi:hypothetical protein